MHALLPWFLVLQALLPALPAGSELQVVSLDLRTVHARAVIQDGEPVRFGAPPLTAGSEARLLIFPGGQEVAARPLSLPLRFASDGVYVRADDGDEGDWLPLRRALHEVGLELAPWPGGEPDR